VQGRIDHAAGLQQMTGFYVLDSLMTGNRKAAISSLKHLVLPSLTLGAAVAAVVARVLRSSMLETLRSDYVTLARAKGAPEWSVVLKHALRNALIPTVTVVGLQIGVYLAGPDWGGWWLRRFSTGIFHWCKALSWSTPLPLSWPTLSSMSYILI
jgi:peptide/nickel transport system permease protein